MKKAEQKINAYQMLLWDNAPMTEEKKVWMTLVNLEERQDKMRRGLYREIGELKKENTGLRDLIYEIKRSLSQPDIFEEELFLLAR